MAKKRFDATLKHLLEKYPQDLSRFLVSHLGLPAAGPVTLIEADIATVSAAADKVFRIGGRHRWLLHVEFQSGPKHHLDRQLLLYNVLLNARHKLPVRSVVLLLKREADRPGLTGVLRQEWPEGQSYLEFRYTVFRLWQQPQESVGRSLGLLPLVPLTDVPVEQLPAVIDRMAARISAEATPAEADELWATTYLLMGLRFSREVAAELLRGVWAMEDSVTYQAIIEEGLQRGRQQGIQEGMAKEARKILLTLGREQFGSPKAAVRSALQAIPDVAQLEALIKHLPTAASWEDLLASAAPRRRNGRGRNGT